MRIFDFKTGALSDLAFTGRMQHVKEELLR